PAESARLGVDSELRRVQWRDVRDRVFGRIDPIAAGGKQYRIEHPDNATVTVYSAHARFTGDKELTVDYGDGSPAETLTADRFVLAAGGRATVPDIAGLSEVESHTSDSVMRIDELPDLVIILGAGFIAAEFAHILAAFGVTVTVVTRSGTMLRPEDDDVSTRFTELVRERMDLRTDRKPVAARNTDGGVALDLDGAHGPETVTTDLLLVATGRVPNTDTLDVAATGISTLDSGHVVVDDYQRTDVEGIYALGDMSSPHELKHVANREARVVQHNLLHPDERVATDHRYIPHAVFSHTQIASVGMTERQARERGVEYVTATEDYAGIAYGWAMEDTTGFAKVLADPTTGL